MDIKDILYTTLIAILVFVIGVNVYPVKVRLGDSVIETNITDFANGINVGGSSFVDSSRNISAGTISGSTITGTGNTAISGTLTVTGTSTLNSFIIASTSASTTIKLGNTRYSGCVAMGMGNGSIMWLWASSGSVYGVEGSTTRPTAYCSNVP